MRNSFVKAIQKVFEQDDKAVLFLGDIGAFLLRGIRDKFPDRFFNVGISEGAMMSAAIGMAMDGWKPYVYTITPFVTARCYDQIRVGIGHNGANVKIVGIGSGLSYSALGATHHSIEDIAMMRTIPNMRIFTPKDGIDTEKAVMTAAKITGPVYLRLMLNSKPISDQTPFGNIKLFKTGKDVLVITIGDVIEEAIKAGDLLAKSKVSCAILPIDILKPLNEKAISKILADYKLVVTVEEHSIRGGLGSAIAEIISGTEFGKKPQLVRMGIDESYPEVYGHKHDVLEDVRLDSKNIYRKIKKCLNLKK